MCLLDDMTSELYGPQRFTLIVGIVKGFLSGRTMEAMGTPHIWKLRWTLRLTMSLAREEEGRVRAIEGAKEAIRG